MNDTWVIGVYIFYNLIYALSSFPLGILADKVGLRKMFIAGLIMFAMVYLGMVIGSGWYVYLLLFSAYGIYAAATEGIAKAWISNIADKKDTATAIGFYSGFQSICTLLASSLTGVIWYSFGSAVAFGITATVTICVVVYFLMMKDRMEVA